MFSKIFKQKIWKSEKGISLIEILIVVSVVTVTLTSLLGVVAFSLKISASTKETVQANAITQEIMEAVRNIRDDDWAKISTNITTGESYYSEIDTDFSPPKWKLTSGEKTENGFTQKVVFDDVHRDNTTDDIESPGDYLDENTMKATVTVSWEDKNVEIVAYFTNWQ